MIRRIIYFLLATIIFGGLAGAIAFYAFDFKPKFLAQVILGAPRPPETVAAEKAKAESWQPTVAAIGTVNAVESIDITPQVGGVVTELFFDSGKQVKAGDKLVQLDFETELAELRALEIQVENADNDLNRKEAVLRRGFGVPADVDTARSLRDQLIANGQRIETLIAQKSIKAPWDGQIGLRDVSVGRYLAPGQRIATLQKVDEVFVDFAVTERDFGRIKTGQKLKASFNAWPGEVFDGTVATTDGQLTTESRTITVRGRFANPGGKLVPGMYADVQVEAGDMRTVTTVPQTAVTYSLYGDSVFAVVPATKIDPNAKPEELAVEKRFVKVGTVTNGRVEIIEGVSAEEQVVIAGQNKIDQGSKIVINNELALRAGGGETQN